MKQTTFASVAWKSEGQVTRRQRFPAELNAVIPWKKLLRRIRPHYVRAGQGRQPHALETMLRIHVYDIFFNLSDPGIAEALYGSPAAADPQGRWMALWDETAVDRWCPGQDSNL